MDPSSPMYDRLKLTPERIEDIADGLRNVAGLASPVGEVLSDTIRPNGLKISKVIVPFGVIGVIYEARPNVSFDVFGLCFRSGNACVLKGGSDARCSNETITGIIRDVLAAEGFDPDVVIQLPADYESTQALLRAVGYVDLPALCAALATKNVIIYADPRAYDALHNAYPAALLQKADETSFGTEFLDYKMSLKTVDTIDEALAHIVHYSSRHSEAIITENAATAEYFTKRVDAACVYTNASTSFTDGAQFSFGAEIGISTQKLHARGPMTLPELTAYKYIITGTDQTRPA